MPIYTSTDKFLNWGTFRTDHDKLGVTSGGFDPLHVGHVRLITESARLCSHLIVLVNADTFLLNKKGYVFMNENERAEIVHSIGGVDDVIIWQDIETQNVAKAIKLLQPHIFCKGGDRTEETMDVEEKLTCKIVGCKIIYGVGGDKICGSQEYTNNLIKHWLPKK